VVAGAGAEAFCGRPRRWLVSDTQARLAHERDYIARTIATVRIHKDADNCWPQWANIFADQIESLEAELERVTTAREREQEIASIMARDLALLYAAGHGESEGLKAYRLAGGARAAQEGDV
jgi:hypothetical protein